MNVSQSSEITQLISRRIEQLASTRTLEQIAQSAGISPETLKAACAGDRRITTNHIPSLAFELGLEPIHLLRLSLHQWGLGKLVKALDDFSVPERKLVELIRARSRNGIQINEEVLDWVDACPLAS